MVKFILLTFWAIPIFAQTPADNFDVAKKIIMSGNSRGAVACVACHQENGAGNAAAGFPQIAGMNAAYFAKQIYDFQNLKRVNAVMQPIAKGLNEAEIKNLAAYFESLKPAENPESNTTESNYQLGKTIAERGLWSKGVPACFACHGPSGRGVGEHFPGLVSQGKTYLVQQLQVWKNGDRKNDPNQLMAVVAKKLTQKEIEAVASYLSGATVGEKK